MARRWVRLRIWMLMVLVAVAAVGMGGWRLTRVSEAYRRLAIHHVAKGREYEVLAGKAEAEFAIVSNGYRIFAKSDGARSLVKEYYSIVVETRLKLSRYRRITSYHFALERKYRQAASRPWLPVAPDPPEPK